MASSVSGKVAFVTGGASGIGAALATELVDGGGQVWIADRQIGAAQELAQRLNSGGAKAHAIELDVRDYPSFERAVAEVVARHSSPYRAADGSAGRGRPFRFIAGCYPIPPSAENGADEKQKASSEE